MEKKNKINVSVSNKEAYYNYHISDTVVAGIILEGTEIKPMIAGHVTINKSFVTINDKNDVIIKNMYIKNVNNNAFSHTEIHDRKLLMTKHQIAKWQKELKIKGTTIVCTKLFYDGRRFKLELGLARGKKLHDKRDAIKERDLSRAEQ
jgi:SsrA-binding protein